MVISCESVIDDSHVVKLMVLYEGSVQWHQPEVSSDSTESIQCKKKMAQPPQSVSNSLLIISQLAYTEFVLEPATSAD